MHLVCDDKDCISFLRISSERLLGRWKSKMPKEEDARFNAGSEPAPVESETAIRHGESFTAYFERIHEQQRDLRTRRVITAAYVDKRVFGFRPG